VTEHGLDDRSPAPAHDPAPVLEARGISKVFGHVRALSGVSFELYPSEVVALLGDNGAGKSSLVKVLSGVYTPDEGELFIDGEQLDIRTPTDALRHGIGTVYQDLALVDTLDVARNIYLGHIPRRLGFVVDFGRMYADARKVLGRLRVSLPSVKTRVGDLSGGQRQAVAIARTLAQEARVFLMDEPTAALGVAQTEKVNELITDLKEQGKTVLLISHNLEHVFSVADRLIVLRHGRRVGIREREQTSREEIVGLITGAVAGD
jgi:ABC-type sugar transport system ATPase subunit